MSKIYCDTIKGINQESFNNVTLYHGFGAFFCSKPITECFYDIMKHSEWQVCTSTKYLGMLGVTIEGTVITASSYDLFSGIDRDNNNRRFFEDDQLDDLVYDYEDIELHEDDDEENNEIVLTNTKVTGIWITSDAGNKTKELALRLSEETGLPLIKVGPSIFC